MPAPYLVLALGGTGESHPGDLRTKVAGMLAAVTDHLDPVMFESRWVGYPAAYGMVTDPIRGIPYHRSVLAGVDHLAARIAADSRPVILLGYSQGAAVVTRFLRRLHAGDFPGLDPSRVMCAGLIANPERPPGTGLDGPVAGYGVTLPARLTTTTGYGFSTPVFDAAHPGDMICSAAPDSMIRPIAPITEFMSLVDLEAWGRDVYRKARTNNWQTDTAQDRDAMVTYQRFLRSLTEAWGYATGRHTSYNVEHAPGTSTPYTTRLAHRISAAVDARMWRDARREAAAAARREGAA